MSKDSIGFGGGDTNLYRMTGNHPNMATDPCGLEEFDPKNVSRSFIDGLVAQRAEWRFHLRKRGDEHSTVSHKYIEPETGAERLAIFRDRTTTSWLFWSETHWELMGTAPLGLMSYNQAFDTIHDSPITAQSYNEAVNFLKAVPLARTALSIVDSEVVGTGLNFVNDVTDVVSLGGTSAARSVGSESVKWAGRGALAGEYGVGSYEAYNNGDYSRLQGAALSTIVRGVSHVGPGNAFAAPKGGFGLNGQIGSLPTGAESSILKGLYLDQVGSTTLGVKLGIHNTIKKITTLGQSKWVTRSDIRKVLEESTTFRVGASTIHKTGDTFVIGGRESFGYFNRATSHHEMMHIGQYIRKPNLIDTRPFGYIHEVIPSYVGTPELYGGGTVIVVGGTYLWVNSGRQ
jgi:hypothetical protein